MTAIPLSLFIAIIILDFLGVTLNTLTLGGLAIAIGEVVDDAIIDVENIFRRLRENRLSENPKPTLQVVLDASLEVRNAVVYATFVVAMVFLPVLTMSGIQGKLFAPLGIAYILAILASLLVALTVTPALSYLFLRNNANKEHEPHYIKTLKQKYENVLSGIAKRPKTVMASAAVLCLLAVGTLPFFGGAFLPEFREGHFIVHMSMIPGTSIEESLRLGTQVTEALLKNPKIRSVSQQVGRAEKGDDTWGTHYSEFNVDLKPLEGEEAEAVQSEIRNTLSRFPGAYFAIKPFLTERIEESISGTTAEVVIKIFGDDLNALDAKAQEIAKLVSSINGAADVQIESAVGTPLMLTRLKPKVLSSLGLQPVDVLETIQTAYPGTIVAQHYEGNRVFDVNVLLEEKSRKTPERIGSLTLRNVERIRIPIREVADVKQTSGRYSIVHEGARRRQAVSCNVRGRDLASFVSEAKKKINSSVSFPPGIYTVFSGAAEAERSAKNEIFLHSLIAGIAIVLLLSIVLENARNLTLVLANLPFALVGGVLAVFFTGGWLSVGSLVGFVTLFGITTRNSIMLISHYEHLVRIEGKSWNWETALLGAKERLLPILMTALVAAFGLLPIAIGSGAPGREIEGPMAIVILGGLLTSTVLNLLVLPTLAFRYGKFEKADEMEGLGNLVPEGGRA